MANETINAFTGRRNALTALFEFASENKWCWNLHCTTCGHTDFRVAFSKIIRGMHPDDPNFFPNGAAPAPLLKEFGEFKDFGRFGSRSAPLALAKVAEGMRIQEIRKFAKLPDWLGYIGLLLEHCQTTDAQHVLNAVLVPQFEEIVPAGYGVLNTPYDIERGNNRVAMNIWDLERIEKVLTPQK